MRKTILFISIILIAAGASGVKAQSTVQVPFVLDNGHVCIAATYKKKTPLRMVLSTFFPSFIDWNIPHVQKTLQLAYTSRIGTTNKQIPVSLVPDIAIGEFSVPKIQMYWSDTLASPNKPGQDYQGVLGSEFFKNLVVRIDYKTNTLTVYKGDAGREIFKTPAPAESRTIVKLDAKTTDFPFEMTYLTTEEILVDGKPAKLLLSINETSKGYTVEKKKIKLGAIELADVPLIKGDPKRFEYILGVDFMKNFIVTVNLSGKKMMFEK